MKHLGAPGPFPKRVTVGNDKQKVVIDPEIYFLGVRMEKAGRLRPGQALMLAATLKKPHSGKQASRSSKGK